MPDRLAKRVVVEIVVVGRHLAALLLHLADQARPTDLLSSISAEQSISS